MKLLEVADNEIVTMDDYPIYDLQIGVSDGVILKLYFRIFQKHCADIIARTIILPKELVASAFDKKIKKKFDDFKNNHPQVKYLALDGNHRTTAASLTKSKIPAILFENDNDCKEIQKMNNSAEVFRPHTNNSINECVLELKDHFLKVNQFYTVAEKTKRMVDDMSIDMPQYMRDSFNQK
ncbi:MAG: hypothetical protein UV42_C0050G0017 [Candidatus Magasanikbacteria bacterium GW2011_GWE2_42_7]|uniref:ParB/Sulfiredoxin domain-containing protein n=1 Tax=Candidatus Magasanikbacteria bacterium GW2011_GWE2_42_7 TaxID=1619052 RepID=A0A0G1BB16_9BACT|nr:MAG: hypothetical protein UV42_C0050G0017 [Candidatus Magasanikbacteria bacterium GW2011_GWE2_42_7]